MEFNRFTALVKNRTRKLKEAGSVMTHAGQLVNGKKKRVKKSLERFRYAV